MSLGTNSLPSSNPLKDTPHTQFLLGCCQNRDLGEVAPTNPEQLKLPQGLEILFW